MNIVHIAAHMGGGIGSAYAGLGSCGMQHTIILLEEPINKVSLAKVEAEGFRIVITPDQDGMRREFEKADAVVFNWTHHPALTKLMYDFPEIPIRSILWCHVSGNYFPHIHLGFLKKFNQAIFATPFSLSLPQVQALEDEYIKEHFAVVYGLGDLSKYAQIEKKPHDKFVVGYVGTLGFCKLHPRFVEYCAAVDISNVEFAMVGTPTTRDEILKAADSFGIADRVVFYGQTSDVPGVLSKMDVFGYLLNPQHFGATENALLEAMAAGLPVVALDQCVEGVIINHEKTGLLVDSPQSYGKAVQRLFEDKNLSARLGNNAREDVLQRFEISANRARFIDVCQRAMNRQKKTHEFSNFLGETPADWFLSCVGADRNCFLENRVNSAGLIFHEETKGSPQHYHAFFPEDERLASWAGQGKE